MKLNPENSNRPHHTRSKPPSFSTLTPSRKMSPCFSWRHQRPLDYPNFLNRKDDELPQPGRVQSRLLWPCKLKDLQWLNADISELNT
jgi:hypothetical protein